MESSYFTQLPF